MQTLGSSTQPLPAKHTAQDDTTVIRFTPDSSGHETAKKAATADLNLPPEVTYGCVEWFDYKSHPLNTDKH